MKKLFFLLMSFFCLHAIAQDNPIKCDSIIHAENKDADALYPLIRAWAAVTFNSAQDVIQMDDPVNGILICKGAFAYHAPGGITYRCIDGKVDYTLKIQVRDGRYKVTMSDFIHHSLDLEWRKTWSFGLITDRERFKPKGMQDKRWLKTWPDLQSKCKYQFLLMVTSLSKATSEKSAVLDDENDDW